MSESTDKYKGYTILPVQVIQFQIWDAKGNKLAKTLTREDAITLINEKEEVNRRAAQVIERIK